jgi:hypothetical protein
MNTPIMVKTLNIKFQKMGFKNMTIKEDTSVKKLNKNFQKLDIGKKRKRESQIFQKNTKKRKMVTDVVLYDKDFINNLFSVMDSIKKNRKYDIRNDQPDIKMEDKHSVKLITKYVYSKNDDNDIDIDIEYDSNVEIDGYASYEDIDLHNEDYDYYDDY